MATRTTLRARLLARIPPDVSKQYSTEFAKRVFSCTSVQQDVLLERFVLAKHFWTSNHRDQQQPQCPSAPPGQRGDSTAAAAAEDSSPSKIPSLKVPQAFFEDDLEVCSSMGGYFLPESISGLTKQRLLSYEPEEDAFFLKQLLKAQGYVSTRCARLATVRCSCLWVVFSVVRCCARNCVQVPQGQKVTITTTKTSPVSWSASRSHPLAKSPLTTFNNVLQGADSTHSIRQDANGGADAEVQTPQPHPKRARMEVSC